MAKKGATGRPQRGINFHKTREKNVKNITFQQLQSIYEATRDSAFDKVIRQRAANPRQQSKLCQCITPFLHFTILYATLENLRAISESVSPSAPTSANSSAPINRPTGGTPPLSDEDHEARVLYKYNLFTWYGPSTSGEYNLKIKPQNSCNSILTQPSHILSLPKKQIVQTGTS